MNEKEESGFPITADVATRMLFALTPLRDELIKAVLEDVGYFF